jgi:hypothetical protein
VLKDGFDSLETRVMPNEFKISTVISLKKVAKTRKWSEFSPIHTIRGLFDYCRYLFRGLTNFYSFNGLQLFSDLRHQALYIFWWTIINVALDSPFKGSSEIFDRPLGRIFSSCNRVTMYLLRNMQTPNQARTRFFPFCGAFE